MPQASDLVGLGVASQLADAIGNTASTLVCTGSSSQANGAKPLTKNVELTAADASHNSATIATGHLVGTLHFFFTSTSTSAVVYPPVGDYMNGTQNAGVTIAQNKGCLIWKYKQTSSAGYWASVLTA